MKSESNTSLGKIYVTFQAGSVIRFFHKDLEAYLTAEGVTGEPTEDGKELFPNCLCS